MYTAADVARCTAFMQEAGINGCLLCVNSHPFTYGSTPTLCNKGLRLFEDNCISFEPHPKIVEAFSKHYVAPPGDSDNFNYD